jgi:hypothetical protein
MNPKNHLLALAGLTFFFIIAWNCGFSDAMQDYYIESETDPVKKEKMRRLENFYHWNGEKEANAEQWDSISRQVDIEFGLIPDPNAPLEPAPEKRKKKEVNIHQDAVHTDMPDTAPGDKSNESTPSLHPPDTIEGDR